MFINKRQKSYTKLFSEGYIFLMGKDLDTKKRK